MRFSAKIRVLKAFVAQFVHLSVPVDEGEHERHVRFLTLSGLISGLGLAATPLLVVAQQSRSDIWLAVTILAAIPFLLAFFVSRTGDLRVALTVCTITIPALLGVLIGMSLGLALPLTLIAAFFCVEPLFWCRQHRVRKAIFMAMISAAAALMTGLWQHASTPLTNPELLALAWVLATTYGALIILRLASTQSTTRETTALQSRVARLAEVNSCELMTIHNRDGATAFVSANSRRLTGFLNTELSKALFLEKVHLQDRVTFLKAISDVWYSRNEQCLRFRFRCNNKGDRVWLWMQATMRADISGAGVVTAVVSTSRDITAEIERQERYQAEKSEFQRVANTQKHFLATMSHELRTPLNAIIGFADVLQQELFGPLANQRHRDYVSHIYSSGEHLLHVVNDLLDLSCIEAGRYELANEEFSVEEVANATLAMMEPLAVKASVSITHDLPQTQILIRGDRRSWRQILTNLLSNAIKFTPEGNSARLTIRRVGKKVELCVIDEGIGMSSQFLETVGQPFKQAETGPDRSFDGTGLGLSVVKGLVDLNDGNFAIDSAPGQGTKVTILLPVRPTTARPIPHVEELKLLDISSPRQHENVVETPTLSVPSKGDSNARLSA